jgi:molybdenum cofactor guanylyltransferase
MREFRWFSSYESEERIMYWLLSPLKVTDHYIVILAGGRSERFGGNKALFTTEGSSFLSRAITKTGHLSIIPRRILISVHDRQQYYIISQHLEDELKIRRTGEPGQRELCWELPTRSTQTIPLQFILDINGQRGQHGAAIFGLQSMCRSIHQGFALCVPCDTPLFPASIMNELISMARSDPEIDAIVPRWENGFIEALHGLYRVESLHPILEENIKKGIFKLRELFTQDLNIRYFDIDEYLRTNDVGDRVFHNINTRDDLNVLMEECEELFHQ